MAVARARLPPANVRVVVEAAAAAAGPRLADPWAVWPPASARACAWERQAACRVLGRMGYRSVRVRSPEAPPGSLCW